MKAFIRLKPLLAVFALVSITAFLLAEPAWWVQRGVRDPQKDPSDYAVLNQGQLKHLARAARDEMNEKLPGGAGAAIDDLVNSWATPSASVADHAVVNVGQLKTVAALFYDRWTAFGLALPPPWSGTGAADYTAANIGQAKHAFDFPILGDSDGDGVNDTWELHHFGTLDRDLSLNFDGDALTDYEDWLARLNPRRWDTDGNGLADGATASANLGLIVYSSLED